MLYEKLDYVLTIAEEKSMTRAAKRLYITQPALTLSINRLENELGVKLFDRSKNPITLTKAGEYYVEKMKPIYYAEQVLRNDIRTVALPEQTLTIAIGQVRGHSWLPKLLPVFCERYPDVNLEIRQITEQDMVHPLKQGKIDLAIGALPVLPEDMEVVNLAEDTALFAAHRKFGLIPPRIRDSYSLENPFCMEPSALNGLPFIRPYVSNGLHSSYEKIISDHHITPKRTISVSNQSTGFELARAGLGVQFVYSMIPEAAGPEGLEDMDFCTLEHMQITRKCVAAWQNGNIKENLIRAAVDIVREQIVPACRFSTPCL